MNLQGVTITRCISHKALKLHQKKYDNDTYQLVPFLFFGYNISLCLIILKITLCYLFVSVDSFTEVYILECIH